MNSENQWYFIVDDGGERNQEGPVSGEDIAESLSAGKLSTETLAWHKGMAEWVKFSEAPDFSKPYEPESPPRVDASIAMEPSSGYRSEGSAKTNDSSDTVTIKDMDNHTIQFSKSRNMLLISTNDYHAGPLVLTKLDLLGFLTTMEASAQHRTSTPDC